jgi:hypothetical protein
MTCQLLPNQTQARAKLLPYKVGALFMEPGTGKTRAAMELINAVDDVDLVVWIGPLNTIRTPDGVPTVMDEVAKWGGFRCEAVYYGIESIQASDRIYLQLYNRIRSNWCTFLVVDESLKIKNSTAKRTKRLMELGQMSTYKLILNGTPLSRNLLDLWPQMQFLSPKILNMSESEFKDTFCSYTRITKKIGRYHYNWTKEFITGYENIDYLYSLIRHYVFECDLTLSVKQIYTNLNYIIDNESIEEYKYLKTKYLDNEVLLMMNNNIFLEMTQKMQHTYCTTEEKFDVVDNLFQEIDQERTIIFTKYIRSAEECRKRYPKATILSYQKEAYGLNMQHLNNTIYFDKVWDYALRRQSGHRTFRTGQEYDCRYWDLTGNVGLENLINKNIEKKISMVEYFKGKTKEELKEIL